MRLDEAVRRFQRNGNHRKLHWGPAGPLAVIARRMPLSTQPARAAPTESGTCRHQPGALHWLVEPGASPGKTFRGGKDRKPRHVAAMTTRNDAQASVTASPKTTNLGFGPCIHRRQQPAALPKGSAG
jgi:hypothetical protein